MATEIRQDDFVRILHATLRKHVDSVADELLEDMTRKINVELERRVRAKVAEIAVQIAAQTEITHARDRLIVTVHFPPPEKHDDGD